MAGGGVIVALDAMARRLERVVENAARLRLHNVAAVAGDGLRPPLRATFGRVLVDAPCSGLGTLRRRPDLKWRMKPEELPRLAEMQRNLLRSAIALCENGGVIVYSVCTTTPEETDDVIAHILETEPVTPEDGPAWLSAWRETAGTYRTGPHRNNTDGFYLTRLRKRS
jgi:16S rRNA (cytosine967-C5)-methyltransferase